MCSEKSKLAESYIDNSVEHLKDMKISKSDYTEELRKRKMDELKKVEPAFQ